MGNRQLMSYALAGCAIFQALLVTGFSLSLIVVFEVMVPWWVWSANILSISLLICSCYLIKLKADVARQQGKIIDELHSWSATYLNEGETIHPLVTGDEIIDRTVEQLSQYQQIEDRSAIIRDVRNKTGLKAVSSRLYFDNRLNELLTAQKPDSWGTVFIIQLRELREFLELDSQTAYQWLDEFSDITMKVISRFDGYVIARHAETDFAVLLPQVARYESQVIAGKLMSEWNSLSLPEAFDKECFFHIGMAGFKTGQKKYQVLAEADMALRAAQLRGAGGFYAFDQRLLEGDVVKGLSHWKTSLEAIISNQDFVMVCQPALRARDKTIHHYEILTRVRNSDGTLVNANVFLPMTRTAGLSTSFDMATVKRAINLLNFERDEHSRCAINIQIDALTDVVFQQWLLEYLYQNKAVLKRLFIEVPEYMFVKFYDELKQVMTDLQKMGIRLMIDHVGDFDCDRSYLEHCNIHAVKLDARVIRNIHQREDNQIKARGIRKLCTDNQVQLFAMGVETSGEWDFVRRHGFTGGQGHFFTEGAEELAALNVGYP